MIRNQPNNRGFFARIVKKVVQHFYRRRAFGSVLFLAPLVRYALGNDRSTLRILYISALHEEQLETLSSIFSPGSIGAELLSELGAWKNKALARATLMERGQDFMEEWELVSAELYLTGLYSMHRELNRNTYSVLDELNAEKNPSHIDAIDDAPWIYAIGHYAYLDLYLKGKALGMIDPKPTELFDSGRICNLPMLSCFGPFPRTTQPNRFPGKNLQAFRVKSAVGNDTPEYDDVVSCAYKINHSWLKSRRGPLARMPDSLVAECRRKLAAVLPKTNGKFVTLHVREGGFRADHHSDGRSAAMPAYIPSIKYLADQGFTVFRLGDPTMTRLPKIDGLIDYAHSELKSDAMDIYLAAHTELHVGTVSGMSWIPGVFARPMLCTNTFPIGSIPTFFPCLFLPKVYRRKSGEIVPISELLEGPAITVHSPDTLRRLGYSFEDNSADEILAAVRESFSECYEELFATGTPRDQTPHQEAVSDLLHTHLFSRYSLICRTFLDKYPGLCPR